MNKKLLLLALFEPIAALEVALAIAETYPANINPEPKHQVKKALQDIRIIRDWLQEGK
jgi:hypothetical protein